ncbi:MAG TPA: DUF1232 domain-containing protein [Candidatus Saccharimonadales bacterium]|jgi:uncharacterized membrane protein YkvA (DUF1232 family)|nr:DUF1232 domain-containing protein [Candidatus Saccharimonadales bacterium]
MAARYHDASTPNVPTEDADAVKRGMIKRFFHYVNDPNVSKLKKIGLMVFFVFLVFWPIDLIPDPIPFVGWLDDIGYVIVDALALVSLFRKGDNGK